MNFAGVDLRTRRGKACLFQGWKLHVNAGATFYPPTASSTSAKGEQGIMSTVEVAASLFGSSDSGSDLDFLTAPESMTNSAAESPAAPGANTSNELFPAQDPSSLFDAAGDEAENSSLFENQVEEETHGHDVNGTHSAQVAAYQPDNAYAYEQEAQAALDHNGESYPGYDDGWYDEQGQWHAYDQQETLGGTGS